jgi:3-(3-hydroxy-phenyl)propionate hydroxylase
MLGPDRAFELVWVSVYSFQCRRLDRFRSGRTFFVGDSAHQISPFGGRGGNSGIQDVDNLVWKLALVIKAGVPERLLDSYDTERCAAADENMLITSRSSDFISPKVATGQALRDAVLELSIEHAFARTMVNSGRLSQPSSYAVSELSTLTSGSFASRLRPGMVCPDAPIERSDGSRGSLLSELGTTISVMLFAEGDCEPIEQAVKRISVFGLKVGFLAVQRTRQSKSGLGDPDGLVFRRFGARAGMVFVIRPDQYVAAVLPSPDPAAIRRALLTLVGEP